MLSGVLWDELKKLFPSWEIPVELMQVPMEAGLSGENYGSVNLRLQKQLAACRRQQDLLYADRLEERISEQLFCRTNQTLEERIRFLERKLSERKGRGRGDYNADGLRAEFLEMSETGRIPNEIAAVISGRVTVYDAGDRMLSGTTDGDGGAVAESGTVVFDFRMK